MACAVSAGCWACPRPRSTTGPPAGGPSTAELEEAYAIHAAREAWCQHRRGYGARRLTAEIRSRGHAWNRKRVARLMRIGGIEGVPRRRRGKYGRRTASTATAADLVERNFTAAAPDQLWVADITYLRTWEGFLYLAVVVDACSRRVVGWAMADHLRTELVLDAVGMGLFARKPAPGLVHHSDRGSQGGFKRSSQHPDKQGCDDGTNSGVDVDEDRPGADAFAGPTAATA
jgi:putative transposase